MQHSVGLWGHSAEGRVGEIGRVFLRASSDLEGERPTRGGSTLAFTAIETTPMKLGLDPADAVAANSADELPHFQDTNR